MAFFGILRERTVYTFVVISVCVCAQFNDRTELGSSFLNIVYILYTRLKSYLDIFMDFEWQ